MLVNILIVSSICAGLGYMVGARRGRAYEGFLLGLFLGLVGLVILSLLKPKVPVISDPSPASAVAEPGPVDTVPFQWLADPSGRHQLRWWDGKQWSEDVVDGDIRSVDALGISSPPPQPF